MKAAGIITLVLGFSAGIATIALLPDSTLFVPGGPAEVAGSGDRYACPMICFIGDKKAPCPVCGMEMTLVKAGELNREQSRRMGIETSRVREESARVVVRAYGAVRWDDRTATAVVARVPGRVVARHEAALHVGNLVKQGDPLVDLYSPEAYAAQVELEAALRLGDETAKRALAARFERWNLAGLAADIIAGKPARDTITIHSPYEGRIPGGDMAGGGDSMAGLPQVGEEIMADRALLRLVDPWRYMVVVHVPETQARWVKTGQPVELVSDDMGALPDVKASVSWVSPELNLEIRSREIHLHIEEKEKRLLPGSLVKARILAGLGADLRPVAPGAPEAAAKHLMVPKSAVLSTGVRNVVWKVEGRDKGGAARFTLAPVALGPRLEGADGVDHYVVVHGLSAGDEVATRGAYLIDSQAQLAGTPSLLFPNGAGGMDAKGNTHQH